MNLRENYKKDKIGLRSEKIRNLMEESPHSLLRWGTIIIVIIFIILGIIVSLLPYPYSNGESIFQHILDEFSCRVTMTELISYHEKRKVIYTVISGLI